MRRREPIEIDQCTGCGVDVAVYFASQRRGDGLMCKRCRRVARKAKRETARQWAQALPARPARPAGTCASTTQEGTGRYVTTYQPHEWDRGGRCVRCLRSQGDQS